MNGHELSGRFRDLESRIAEEKGGFALFALFMREDAPDRWDLIVSAPWIGSDKRRAVDYFVEQIKARLGAQDLTWLARIVVVDPLSTFLGMPVKHAFIITSRRPPAPAAA